MVETTKRSKSTGTEVAEKAAHTEQRRNGERNGEDRYLDVECDLPAVRAVIVTDRSETQTHNIRMVCVSDRSVTITRGRRCRPPVARAVVFSSSSVAPLLRVARFLRTLRCRFLRKHRFLLRAIAETPAALRDPHHLIVQILAWRARLPGRAEGSRPPL